MSGMGYVYQREMTVTVTRASEKQLNISLHAFLVHYFFTAVMA